MGEKQTLADFLRLSAAKSKWPVGKSRTKMDRFTA